MRRIVEVVALLTVVAAAAISVAGVAAAGTGPSARGGGVVGGDAGLTFGASTSQFGFTATRNGGQFQCVMAGRSAGFQLPDGTTVLSMDVHGDVTPGTLTVEKVTDHDIHGQTVTGLQATFSGISIIKIVGRAPDGSIIRVVMEEPYELEVLEGRAGTAILHLHHPNLDLHTGGVVEHGRINVSQ